MEFRKFARAFTCASCGKTAKASAPQDVFKSILSEWGEGSEEQFIFCNLNCLKKWILKLMGADIK